LSFGDSGTDRPFSIQAWVYINSTAATNYIAAKRNVTPVLEYQYTITTSGNVALVLFSGGAGSIALATRNSATLSTGAWHHLVATYDGSKTVGGMKIYIDGSSQALTDISFGGTYAGMNNTASKVYIGGFADASPSFNGIIDEVGIWSKVLTQAEVTSLYNSGSGLSYDSFN